MRTKKLVMRQNAITKVTNNFKLSTNHDNDTETSNSVYYNLIWHAGDDSEVMMKLPVDENACFIVVDHSEWTIGRGIKNASFPK